MRRFSILLLILISQILYAMPPFQLEAVRDGYQIDMSIPDIELWSETVKNKLVDGTPVNETFTRMAIPGFNATAEQLGNPEILASTFQMALEDEAPLIEVSNIVTQKISLSNKVYPLQPPEEYCESGEHAKKPEYFYYNKAAYRTVSERGLSVFVSQTYNYRGQKAASIEVRPVSYDPVNNTVTVAKNIAHMVQSH